MADHRRAVRILYCIIGILFLVAAGVIAALCCRWPEEWLIIFLVGVFAFAIAAVSLFLLAMYLYDTSYPLDPTRRDDVC